jgi:putative transposase
MIVRGHQSVSVRRQCELLSVNRSTAYYESRLDDSDAIRLMRLIDEQHLKTPFFGSRQMAHWLSRCEGYPINRKRVQRLMQIMELRAIAPRPSTSRPHPKHKVYPYLLRGVEVTRANQVWAADITYVPMARGYGYLVAIIDWYTRMVLGWRLSNSLDTRFCVEALNDALAQWYPPDIFNTDQGTQFTAEAWIERLKTNHIAISMDGRGRYLDNVFVERLWRTVKYEEIYLRAYVDLREAREHLARYFAFYNNERPHAAHGGSTPAAAYKHSLESNMESRRSLEGSVKKKADGDEDRSRALA